ncbi:MAG: chloride channel protein [Bdellovibrionota bacterium]
MDSTKHPDLRDLSTTNGLPVAPSLSDALISGSPRMPGLVDRRLIVICAYAFAIALVTSVIALFLVNLISLITNLAFYQRVSLQSVEPAGNALGPLVVFVPVIGGLIVGLMARYGSKAIRGHGIPEAMEQVLSNESIIPARLTFLKPVSAAISIGTGGPFGAEGPIIASGGAFGSLVGQILKTTAHERKTLLAAGAAAGMTAIFGSPVSAVILTIELLVFEYRPRSFVPIAIAAASAATLRIALFGASPAFSLSTVAPPTGVEMLVYLAEGILLGFASIGVTKLVYWIEDQFEKLPIHWMWWPAIGGVVVGMVGYWFPNTMGVGYENIDKLLAGTLPMKFVAVFCFMKLVSWSVSLGTGTSGGTLAPLFTIGGGVGLIFAEAVNGWFPALAVSPGVAALVGMAAIFAGASRAMLASVLFAFETTRQPWAILPLLIGCTAAYVISCLRMKTSIMTEKISRRGIRVPGEYGADPLSQVTIRDVATKKVTSFNTDETIQSAWEKLSSGEPQFHHQGYPVLDAHGEPVGVFTYKDLIKSRQSEKKTVRDLVTRAPVIVSDNASLAVARDKLVQERIGRLLVVHSNGKLLGILTRTDVLRAYSLNLSAETTREAKLRLRTPRGRVRNSKQPISPGDKEP